MAGNNEELDQSTAALLETLRSRIKRSGRSIRGLEQELGLGHGTLGNVVSGRSNLRMRHVELVARGLRIPLRDLFAEAFPAPPEPASPPRSRLRKVIAEEVRNELSDFWRRHVLRLEDSGALVRVEEIEPD